MQRVTTAISQSEAVEHTAHRRVGSPSIVGASPEPRADARIVDRSRLDSVYVRIVKPLFDRVVAALLILCFAPVFAGVAAAVRAKLGSPILYKQRRVGQHGEPLWFVKYRSMLPDRRALEMIEHDYDGPDRRITHKTDDDPRHTPLGRFLRKTSLDELPQLLLVLKGEMSLVGPRPELESVVEDKYEAWQHQRHLVKPGVTGLWQVTTRQQGRLLYEDTDDDLDYIENISFVNDLRILVATPFAAVGLEKAPLLPKIEGKQVARADAPTRSHSS